MIRATGKAMSDWLSPERKRINEIMSAAGKAEPRIQRSEKTGDERAIDAVDRPNTKNDGNLIYEMFGATGARGKQLPEKSTATDVIGSLYEQYCRALDDPLASFSGEWSSSLGAEHGDAPAVLDYGQPSNLRQQARQPGESIEAVISGVRGVEHFFGKLEKGNSPPAAELEPVPEILHLFAPPEFKARTTRLPSALVRREHHAPGLDSPLYAPRLATQSESAL